MEQPPAWVFHGPQSLTDEANRHVQPNASLVQESGIGAFAARRVMTQVLSRIAIHDASEYAGFEPYALELAPHAEDAPYLALAMALDCPVWSNDRALANQSAVRVLTTQDVFKTL